MHRVQRKMLGIHHGYFMGIGLPLALTGIFLQLWHRTYPVPGFYEVMTVIGALLLGYGTGRCDEKCSMDE